MGIANVLVIAAGAVCLTIIACTALIVSRSKNKKN